MQNRYVGDVGDFAKYSLLNALSEGQRLGVAWYLYPDEDHNADGKHITYLENPDIWRQSDPFVFDSLTRIIDRGERSVNAVIENQIVVDVTDVADELLACPSFLYPQRATFRKEWFERTMAKLDSCDIVFADPDNGLRTDEKFKNGNRKNWKSIPVSEVFTLSKNRTAVIYHHNTRFKGGHNAEITYWLTALPQASFAIRFRAYSVRTFFVTNAKAKHYSAAQDWCERFGGRAKLYMA